MSGDARFHACVNGQTLCSRHTLDQAVPAGELDYVPAMCAACTVLVVELVAAVVNVLEAGVEPPSFSAGVAELVQLDVFTPEQASKRTGHLDSHLMAAGPFQFQQCTGIKWLP